MSQDNQDSKDAQLLFGTMDVKTMQKVKIMKRYKDGKD